MEMCKIETLLDMNEWPVPLLLACETRGATCPAMKTKTVITEGELPPAVIRAIEQGRKIEAIKLLREATGLGLANAKVLVDRAAREHSPKNLAPGFVSEETNGGKLLKALLIIAIAYFLYYRFIGS
jgi:hypothetical protein